MGKIGKDPSGAFGYKWRGWAHVERWAPAASQLPGEPAPCTLQAVKALDSQLHVSRENPVCATGARWGLRQGGLSLVHSKWLVAQWDQDLKFWDSSRALAAQEEALQHPAHSSEG